MDGEDFSYFCRHGEMPPPKPTPARRDSTIEPPARHISYTFDEPAEPQPLPPQAEGGAEDHGAPDTGKSE